MQSVESVEGYSLYQGLSKFPVQYEGLIETSILWKYCRITSFILHRDACQSKYGIHICIHNTSATKATVYRRYAGVMYIEIHGLFTTIKYHILQRFYSRYPHGLSPASSVSSSRLAWSNFISTTNSTAPNADRSSSKRIARAICVQKSRFARHGNSPDNCYLVGWRMCARDILRITRGWRQFF